MTTLYLLLIIMLMAALIILAIPFVKNRQITLYVATAFFVILSSSTLYDLFGSSKSLQQWLNVGQEHYQLIEAYNHLGGIDGIITRIKMKLAVNPNDAAGWFILGKLYLAKHDDEAAKQAFRRAHELAPDK